MYPPTLQRIHGTMRSLSPPVACGIVNDITDCRKQLDGEKPDDAQNLCVYGHGHNYNGEKQTANAFSFLVFSRAKQMGCRAGRQA